VSLIQTVHLPCLASFDRTLMNMGKYSRTLRDVLFAIPNDVKCS
jgi:hypothetical protein